MEIFLVTLFMCFTLCASELPEDGREAVEPEYLDYLLREKKFDRLNELLGIHLPHLSQPRSEEEQHDPRYNPHLAHGDILPHWTSKDEARNYINLTRWPGSKWKNGILYYCISKEGYTSQQRYNIRQLVEACNKELDCVQLTYFEVDATYKPVNYVWIFPGDGCYSKLGCVGKQQPLSLPRGCWSLATCCHELLHALGCMHEQCRTDRDTYIKMHWKHIKEEWWSQFDKADPPDFDTQKTLYDCYSVMHYPNYHPDMCPNKSAPAFDCLDSKCDPNKVGYAENLSSGDKEKLRKAYCTSTG